MKYSTRKDSYQTQYTYKMCRTGDGVFLTGTSVECTIHIYHMTYLMSKSTLVIISSLKAVAPYHEDV